MDLIDRQAAGGVKTQIKRYTIMREPNREETEHDIEFLSGILMEIREYAVACGQEPDETLRAVAEWILTLLEVATFNGGNKK